MTPSPPPPDERPLAAAAALARRWAGGRSGWAVDAFAGAEIQRAALRGGRADGAWFARAAAGPEVRVVLVEEDPGLVARLQADLAAAGLPFRRGGFADAAPGEVLLVEEAFAAALPALAAEVGGAPAFVRLAPGAARALPWDAVAAVAALPGAELLLRLPADDFARAARFAGPIADLPPHLRRTAAACSALLGDAAHAWLAAWRRAGPRDAVAGVADALLARLASAAPGARVARLPLAGGPVLHLTREAEPEAPELFPPLDFRPPAPVSVLARTRRRRGNPAPPPDLFEPSR